MLGFGFYFLLLNKHLLLLFVNQIDEKQEFIMAKYSKKAGEKVEETMHEMKEGKLKSGKSGKKVTSKKQAVAIGLSEARKEGAKVPKKKS
ncbi:hypothetical protein GCM10023231_21550 [Olivibacter ginsenosidimutans]|uniref:Histone H1 n=2 Tax=Olivibacter ginsenosidimutans TaxID=1176537 RepID=A0ABP9BAY4_9SPHI